jgi:hypothetical protein
MANAMGYAGAGAWANRPAEVREASPSFQAFQILYFGFIILPVVAGADKLVNWLVSWDIYLAPQIAAVLPLSVPAFMAIVGAIEIAAGLLVAFRPAVGGLVVGLWLCGIVLNLLIGGEYYDIALRDIGLALGAFALSRLGAELYRPDLTASMRVPVTGL